jgi:8-oxo-dGTP diphosphatase
VRRVSKVIMIDENDKVLILRRSGRQISDASPWEWDLPGGHVERDESLEKALDREVWEETSLDLSKATKIYTDDYTTFFVSYEWEGEIMLSKEHDDYKWINPEEATNYYIGEKYERAIGRITAK